MGIPEIKQGSSARFYPVPYAEGTAPPNDQIENHLDAVGRRVIGNTYQELTSQLQPDERLIALYWNCPSGTGDFVPQIDSQETFNYFEQYVFPRKRKIFRRNKGQYYRLAFWALPEKEVPNRTSIG